MCVVCGLRAFPKRLSEAIGIYRSVRKQEKHDAKFENLEEA